MKKIILASASPRRIELLHQIGIEAEVRPVNADESFSADLTPAEIVEELSRRKAAAAYEQYAAQCDDTVILAADTVVSIHGKILGKPADEEEAYRMLRLLSGKRNIVYTGVTLLLVSEGKIAAEDVFHNATSVYVFPLDKDEIHDYIRSGEPMDKAGAYGIQGIFGRYVQRVEGDYNNVVGLPAAEVYQHLKKLRKGTERDE